MCQQSKLSAIRSWRVNFSSEAEFLHIQNVDNRTTGLCFIWQWMCKSMANFHWEVQCYYFANVCISIDLPPIGFPASCPGHITQISMLSFDTMTSLSKHISHSITIIGYLLNLSHLSCWRAKIILINFCFLCAGTGHGKMFEEGMNKQINKQSVDLTCLWILHRAYTIQNL